VILTTPSRGQSTDFSDVIAQGGVPDRIASDVSCNGWLSVGETENWDASFGSDGK
jgi:hypothetical protein